MAFHANFLAWNIKTRFLGKIGKNVINLSSAEFAKWVVKVIDLKIFGYQKYSLTHVHISTGTVKVIMLSKQISLNALYSAWNIIRQSYKWHKSIRVWSSVRAHIWYCQGFQTGWVSICRFLQLSYTWIFPVLPVNCQWEFKLRLLYLSVWYVLKDVFKHLQEILLYSYFPSFYKFFVHFWMFLILSVHPKFMIDCVGV